MRHICSAILSASFIGILSGCTIQFTNPPADSSSATLDEDTSLSDGPVVDDPGVVVVDEEPPPPERQYIYDPGYPPGTYFYGGYYYYGRYRYPHDVFVHRYVDVNVHQHRYVDVNRNRHMGAAMVQRQRADYARTGGRHTPAGHPVQHGGHAGPSGQHQQGGPGGPDHGDHNDHDHH
jgi:hypothetical protein